MLISWLPKSRPTTKRDLPTGLHKAGAHRNQTICQRGRSWRWRAGQPSRTTQGSSITFSPPAHKGIWSNPPTCSRTVLSNSLPNLTVRRATAQQTQPATAGRGLVPCGRVTGEEMHSPLLHGEQEHAEDPRLESSPHCTSPQHPEALPPKSPSATGPFYAFKLEKVLNVFFACSRTKAHENNSFSFSRHSCWFLQKEISGSFQETIHQSHTRVQKDS